MSTKDGIRVFGAYRSICVNYLALMEFLEDVDFEVTSIFVASLFPINHYVSISSRLSKMMLKS
jgi:hypothetical protein